MSSPTSSEKCYTLNVPTHGEISIHPQCSSSFKFPTALTITPSVTHPTDLWRKPGPPEISTFNAPILYRKLLLKHFQSVRVMVSAQWETLYDQGGLVFILPEGKKDGNGYGYGEEVDGEAVGKRSKWVKTGIEVFGGKALVGTVVRDRWADWSLYPVGIREVGGEGKKKGVELLIERLEGDDTFWVYVVDEQGGKLPIRECTWVLSEDGGEREVWVGIYAATPKGMEDGEKEKLAVCFEGLKWEFRD